MHEVRLWVGGEGADAEEAAELTFQLRDELIELDVDVTSPSADANAGAKGDAVAWAQLAVTFSGSLPALIGAIRSWRERQRGASVRIEQDGDQLVLSDATPEEQSAIVQAWLARHDSA